MSNIQIETDLKEILNKLDSKIDNLQQDIKSDQKKVLEEVNALKLGQAEIKGDIKALDTKVDQLDKRISNSEFTNRGVLIGLVVVILGGAAKLFGFTGNP